MPLRVIEQPPREFKKYTDVNMIVACDHEMSETLTDVYTYATLKVMDLSGHLCDVVGQGPTAVHGEPDDGLIVYAFREFIIKVPGTYQVHVHVYSRENEEPSWIGTVATQSISVLNFEN